MGNHGFWKLPSAHDTLVNEKRSPSPHCDQSGLYFNFFRNSHAELNSGDPQWYFT